MFFGHRSLTVIRLLRCCHRTVTKFDPVHSRPHQSCMTLVSRRKSAPGQSPGQPVFRSPLCRIAAACSRPSNSYLRGWRMFERMCIVVTNDNDMARLANSGIPSWQLCFCDEMAHATLVSATCVYLQLCYAVRVVSRVMQNASCRFNFAEP